MTRYVRDATLGWQYMIDHLSLYFERALAVQDEDARAKEVINGSPLVLAQRPIPALMAELLGTFENMAHLLGVRTAELHGALSSRPEVPGVFAGAIYRLLSPRTLPRDAGADGTIA